MKSPIRQILFQKKYNKKTNKELEWKKIRIKVFPLIKSLNLRRKGQKFVVHICFVCDVIFFGRTRSNEMKKFVYKDFVLWFYEFTV